jgi:hypothetical protein
LGRRERSGALKYYHTTDAAELILEEGFQGSSGRFGFASFELEGGCFVGDQHMDINEGVKGTDVFEIVIPDDFDLDNYELVEDVKPYREWYVPAYILNKFPRRLLSEDELDSLVDIHWDAEHFGRFHHFTPLPVAREPSPLGGPSGWSAAKSAGP